MQIKTKYTNLNLTPETKEQLNKKIESISKIVGEEQNILFEVEFGKSTKHQTGDVFRTEINITIDGNHFRSESENADLYSSTDDAKAEIENTLRSYKNKKKSWVRRSGTKLKDFIRKFYK
jgi:ribosomal subunit interface protein